MKILLPYHKDPFGRNGRGAERSVSAIVKFLRERFHEVELIGPTILTLDESHVKGYDLVLSWGHAALAAAHACKMHGVPFALMVRFWKNVCPLPAEDLMTRPVNEVFARQRRQIFKTARAIITNSHYAKGVIERWQPCTEDKTHVSYVPICGKYKKRGDRSGAWLVVTPEIYAEDWLIANLAPALPEEKFLVVNCWNERQRKAFEDAGPNVTATMYADMDEVWSKAKGLLLPIYDHDICGTRRVSIEVFRHGLPVIASDRCGVSEKIPAQMLVSRQAQATEWIQKIKRINMNYEQYRTLARAAWERYDTIGELVKFENILLECLK